MSTCEAHEGGHLASSEQLPASPLTRASLGPLLALLLGAMATQVHAVGRQCASLRRPAVRPPPPLSTRQATDHGPHEQGSLPDVASDCLNAVVHAVPDGLASLLSDTVDAWLGHGDWHHREAAASEQLRGRGPCALSLLYSRCVPLPQWPAL